jgi:hypothetical protein
MKFGNYFTPAKTVLFFFLMTAAVVLSSCSRGITPFEAANGKAKCGTYLK